MLEILLRVCSALDAVINDVNSMVLLSVCAAIPVLFFALRLGACFIRYDNSRLYGRVKRFTQSHGDVNYLNAHAFCRAAFKGLPPSIKREWRNFVVQGGIYATAKFAAVLEDYTTRPVRKAAVFSKSAAVVVIAQAAVFLCIGFDWLFITALTLLSVCAWCALGLVLCVVDKFTRLFNARRGRDLSELMHVCVTLGKPVKLTPARVDLIDDKPRTTQPQAASDGISAALNCPDSLKALVSSVEEAIGQNLDKESAKLIMRGLEAVNSQGYYDELNQKRIDGLIQGLKNYCA